MKFDTVDEAMDALRDSYVGEPDADEALDYIKEHGDDEEKEQAQELYLERM